MGYIDTQYLSKGKVPFFLLLGKVYGQALRVQAATGILQNGQNGSSYSVVIEDWRGANGSGKYSPNIEILYVASSDSLHEPTVRKEDAFLRAHSAFFHVECKANPLYRSRSFEEEIESYFDQCERDISKWSDMGAHNMAKDFLARERKILDNAKSNRNIGNYIASRPPAYHSAIKMGFLGKSQKVTKRLKLKSMEYFRQGLDHPLSRLNPW